MYIIGITGTLGAGKGTVVEYLVKEKGFTHYSVRGFLRGELEQHNMPVNRDTLTAIANTLRAKHGPAYIAEQLIKKAKETGKNCAIESIRTPGEIDALRKHENFYLLAIDADPRIRYQRIRKRNSETDKIPYQVFVENEQREMHTRDPNKQNLAACIRKADHVIQNNGNIEQLNILTENFLDKIGFYRKQ